MTNLIKSEKVARISDTVDEVVPPKPNLLINGDFGIWQRGDIKNDAGYLADRWRVRNTSRTGGTTIQDMVYSTSAVQENGNWFFLKHTATNHTSSCYINQNIELTKNMASWSQEEFTVAVDFNFDNEVEMQVSLYLVDASDHTNNLAIAESGYDVVTTGRQTKIINLTTVDLAGLSASGFTPDYETDYIQLYVQYRDKNDGLGIPNGDYRFHNIKLEEGNTFTGWPYVDPATELAKCQRYYHRITQPISSGAALCGVGLYNTATEVLVWAKMPTTMRKIPDVSYSSLADFDLEPFDVTPTTLTRTLHGSTPDTVGLKAIDGTSRTQGTAAALVMEDANQWIDFDAEL